MKILFVGTAFPPANAGSAVVMREMLGLLPKESWNVICMASDGATDDAEFESRILRVGSRMEWAGRFSTILRVLRVFFLLPQAKHYAKGIKPSVIVSPYPSLDYLLLGGLLARLLNIPFLPYLHDTIAEMSEHSGIRYLSRMIQNYVFRSARKILVMSDGMAALYKEKYGIEAIAIEHPYKEAIASSLISLTQRRGDAFWSGSVYGINDKAVKRVFDAVCGLGRQFTFTARMKRSMLAQQGIDGDNVKIVDLPTRDVYLEYLKRSGVAILALNAKSESRTGADELATIFPTKTPEYLAAGLPILIHCPEHYFLARFFEENQCGLVVSDCSVDKIANAIEYLLSDSDDVRTMRYNAIRVAKRFSPEYVIKRFLNVAESVGK